MKTLDALTAICLTACISLNNANAQTDFWTEKKSEFNKNPISLEQSEVSLESVVSGLASYYPWEKTNVFQGMNSVKESSLLNTTRYDYYGRSSNTLGKVFFWSGLGLMAGGAVLMLATKEDKGLTGLWWGAGITMTGIVMFSLGYWSFQMNAIYLNNYGTAKVLGKGNNLNFGLSIKTKL